MFSAIIAQLATLIATVSGVQIVYDYEPNKPAKYPFVSITPIGHVKTESVFGTAVTPILSVPISPSDGIQINQDVVGIEAIKTTAPKNKRFMLGKAEYSGGFEVAAYVKSIGYFLNSVFGTDTPSTLETGVYKHKFTESTTKKSLTVEQVVGTITKRFAGYIVSSVKITGKTGEPVKITFSGMAKSQADASKISATYETSRPLNFADVASILIGGTDFSQRLCAALMIPCWLILRISLSVSGSSLGGRPGLSLLK